MKFKTSQNFNTVPKIPPFAVSNRETLCILRELGLFGNLWTKDVVVSEPILEEQQEIKEIHPSQIMKFNRKQ